jgi:hypothetical protein
MVEEDEGKKDGTVGTPRLPRMTSTSDRRLESRNVW